METDGITSGLDDAEIDLSDETQDFRFLAAMTKKGDGSVPKRGEKDFEPDGTNLQSGALNDSRSAMFQALSVDRTHTSKTRVTATWRPSRSLAQVHEQRGVLFKSMGRADKSGTTWLLPEELLYMVERGTLECLYEEGIPMSVQAVYAAALDATGGLEKYQVYSNLRRSGYSVFRDPGFQFDDLFKAVNYHYREDEGQSSIGIDAPGTASLGIFASLFTSIFRFGWQKYPFRSLLPPGAYANYAQIFNRLLLPSRPSPRITASEPDPLYGVIFHVWKPKPQFKKSNPGPPDFYVSVVSTNGNGVPSLVQLQTLFQGIPKSDNSDKPLYQSLKDGKRNVILAVVDYGVISYMKFSDSAFRDHPLDVDPPKNIKGKGTRKYNKAKS